MRIRQLRQGIVLYLRVSSDDKQNPENSFEYQRQCIHRRIEQSHMDLSVLSEYSDVLSGLKNQRRQYQQMLTDARNRLFSHLAIYSIDRLGRSPEEILNSVKELIGLGIEIIVADSPNLDIASPSGSLLLGIRAVIAQYEVNMLSQRLSDNKRALMHSGRWPTMLPDGYVRRSEPGLKPSQLPIEKDSARAKIMREAWDLLLTGTYTLQKICQELHNRGYTRRSGLPFVWVDPKTSETRYATSQIDRAFHLPFYAGWVISERHNIQRGDVRGQWEPLVTDEEFDRGIAILLANDENKIRKIRHDYMLRGILYMRIPE